jgi:DNA-binding NarL/FixJ family response regulator
VAGAREGIAFTPRLRDRRAGRGGQNEQRTCRNRFLSEKTIENNLSRIYAKLGVRSRTELAAALASRA